MYYRARFYDTELGRFLQKDPLTNGPDDPRVCYKTNIYSFFDRVITENINSLDPHNTNRYVYCRNNPINFTDPLGLEAGSVALSIWTFIKIPKPPIMWVGSAVVAVSAGTGYLIGDKIISPMVDSYYENKLRDVGEADAPEGLEARKKYYDNLGKNEPSPDTASKENVWDNTKTSKDKTRPDIRKREKLKRWKKRGDIKLEPKMAPPHKNRPPDMDPPPPFVPRPDHFNYPKSSGLPWYWYTGSKAAEYMKSWQDVLGEKDKIRKKKKDRIKIPKDLQINKHKKEDN